MLETAERFTDHEGEPAVQQYLLLVGGLRTLARGEHAPHLILDAFLLRSLAVNGYAPSFERLREVRHARPEPVLLRRRGRRQSAATAGCPAASYPRRRPSNCSARC